MNEQKTMSNPLFNNKKLAFKLFHFTFVLIILLASLKTVVDAVADSNWPLLALAGAEVIAVLLFPLPRFIKASGIALMSIFAIAIIFATLAGILLMNLQLIIYLVCTYFIIVYTRDVAPRQS